MIFFSTNVNIKFTQKNQNYNCKHNITNQRAMFGPYR